MKKLLILPLLGFGFVHAGAGFGYSKDGFLGYVFLFLALGSLIAIPRLIKFMIRKTRLLLAPIPQSEHSREPEPFFDDE